MPPMMGFSQPGPPGQFMGGRPPPPRPPASRPPSESPSAPTPSSGPPNFPPGPYPAFPSFPMAGQPPGPMGPPGAPPAAWQMQPGQQHQQQEQLRQQSGGLPAAPTASASAHSSGAESESEALRQKEASAWIAHKAGDGQVYYYNTLTNESTWEKPEGYKGDASKASAQPKPLATQLIKGTDWSEVVCEDGKKYFYNTTTLETSWTVPPEVEAVRGRQPQVPASAPSISPAAATHLARVQAQLGASAIDGDEDMTFTADDIAPPTSEAQPALPEEEPPPPLPPKKSAAEAAQDFRELLAEKGVTPFSRWERELPKLITDGRWTAVGSLKERRLIFDEYCKSCAADHKRGKADGARAARDAFLALLDEAAKGGAGKQGEDGESIPGIGPDTTVEALATYWGNDPRWKGCDEKLRAELIEARVAPLRVLAAHKAQVSKQAQETAYRELLKQHKVGPDARWSKTKEALAADARYKELPRDDRERLFRAYVAEQEARERAERKERAAREEKDREARAKLAREAEESERRRRKAGAADAAANYQTLLSETVKDPDANWHEWKQRLARDPQGRFSNPNLDPKAAESLFREHLVQLQKRAVDSYVELLEEVIKPLLPKSKGKDEPRALRSFSEAERLMGEDARFLRAPARDREKLWRRYVEDITMERDNPAAAARRGRLISSSRTARGPHLNDAAGAVTDKAYEREYLAHDRKRIRRD
ncbi:Transcription elongation regulator 1 [Coccomyxa sp. Obi]|nr:Transcription elongation regulator 1 [Coccomyxa sp. Obi]